MKAQTDMQLLKLKVEGEIAKITSDSEADQSLENLNARNDLIKIREDFNSSMQEISANLAANMQVERTQSEMAIAEKTVEHRNTMVEMGTDYTYDSKLQSQKEAEIGEREDG
jgi:hypothetical protein